MLICAQKSVVVLCAKGYPGEVQTGQVITGLDALPHGKDVIAFHGATARRDGALVTVGGRVMGITALGANLEQAIERAYDAVGCVKFDGMHFRRDIGKKALARLHPHRTES